MQIISERQTAGLAPADRGSGARRASSGTDRGLTPERDTGRIRGVIVAVLVATFVLGQSVAPAAADGESWTEIAAPEVRDWQSVAYGNGVWVAVAKKRDFTSAPNLVMRSTDGGLSWTAVATTEENTWRSVAYGNGVWVAVAQDGTNRVKRSTDGGLSWTAVAAAEANAWRSVAYAGGVWIAVASTGTNRVMRSTDGGLSWTAVAAAEANAWRSVAYGNGVWVAVAEDGTNRVMRSTDGGQNWVSVAATEASGWTSVAYGDGVWVAVAQVGTNRVLRSTDGGQNWSVTAAAEDNAWQGVAFGEGVWVAVASFGTNRVMRSTDGGQSWTAVAAANASSWFSVANGNGVWIAVAQGGTSPRVMRSVSAIPPSQPVPPSVTCRPEALVAGAVVTCTVTGGDAGIDILWRSAHSSVIAEAGVTLDEAGVGVFSFIAPAGAVGEEVTVELVEWAAPVSLGVVGGPVPSSVPSGGGPQSGWPFVLLALAGVLVLRRGMRAEA